MSWGNPRSFSARVDGDAAGAREGEVEEEEEEDDKEEEERVAGPWEGGEEEELEEEEEEEEEEDEDEDEEMGVDGVGEIDLVDEQRGLVPMELEMVPQCLEDVDGGGDDMGEDSNRRRRLFLRDVIGEDPLLLNVVLLVGYLRRAKRDLPCLFTRPTLEAMTDQVEDLLDLLNTL